MSRHSCIIDAGGTKSVFIRVLRTCACSQLLVRTCRRHSSCTRLRSPFLLTYLLTYLSVDQDTSSFLRATAMLSASILVIVESSVRPSSPNFRCGLPQNFSFCDKFWFRWVKRFPSNEGVKEGYPQKVDILLLFWSSEKRLQRGTDLFTSVPWLTTLIILYGTEPLTIKSFSIFLHLLAAAHISTTNCAKN